MKPIPGRIVHTLWFIAVSCIGGWYLGAFVSRSPFWMPEWMFKVVAAAVKSSGERELYDEDDIETIALTCLLIVSSITVAIVLRIIWNLIARGFKRCL